MKFYCFRSAIAVLLSYTLMLTSVCDLSAQTAQQDFQNLTDGSLFGTLPNFPKTRAQFEQYLVMRGMSAVLGNTLPIKLDASKTFPTVEDSALPGGPFHGKPLEVSPENLTRPLPDGDWIVPALAFCQEYSVHQPGAGTAYKIAPLQGTKAELIATFLWRGVLAGKQPSELQLVEWAIESGVPYSRMPKPYQADIDQLIPTYKNQLQGSWVEQPDAKYQAIVAKPAEELKIAGAIPGVGMLLAKVLLRTMPAFPPTFEDFLKKYKMGKAGELYGDAKKLYGEFTKPYTDEQLRAQKVFEGQGTKLAPVPAQNGPWTVKAPGFYMRFIVHSGNLHTDNELQIRVTTPQVTASAERKPHLVYASYNPQAAAANTTQQTTLLSLMGVSLAGPGLAVAGRTVTALEASELAGVVVSGAEIAFAIGVGVQALIIVLPPLLNAVPQSIQETPEERRQRRIKALPETGTCTPAQYTPLKNDVESQCKPPGLRKCFIFDSCPVIQQKIMMNGACIAARNRINNACFLGGDDSHQDRVSNEQDMLQNCWIISEKKQCH